MVFNAYIIEAVRTAGGRKNGTLSHYHPADLGGMVIDAILDRTQIDPIIIDDVIFGCVSQVGAQSGNIGRGVVLSSKLPESVPGVTIDRQCGSSLQAFHFAAQAVMSGTQDIIIAGGVEVMSLVPIGASVTDGLANNHGMPMGERMKERYQGVMFSQFEGAEIVAERYNVSREEMEQFASLSHKRGYEATKNGHFKREIVAVEGIDPKTKQPVRHVADEGIRYPTDPAKLAQLPTIKPGPSGRITAGTASQICDGASAILIVNERGLRKLPLTIQRPRVLV